MRENNSFTSDGGYGATMIIDRCLSSHLLAAKKEEGQEQEVSNLSSSNVFSEGNPQPYRLISHEPFFNNYIRTIRFQVVVWYVGAVDVMQGRVAAKFRVTLFWNDDGGGNERRNRMTKLESSEWVMQGRQKAVEQKISDEISERTVDIPPLSILNAVSFDIIGKPEVKLLREKTKLMRWTCLYKAVLFQDEYNMRVEKFPHDEHVSVCSFSFYGISSYSLFIAVFTMYWLLYLLLLSPLKGLVYQIGHIGSQRKRQPLGPK
mmetsp:Transcript_36512/g.55864  ORF Transcript_36512/g.55864 Transcript_36512/m.55864 type:complete len:261 (+) Transcript_36512:115-897(+)